MENVSDKKLQQVMKNIAGLQELASKNDKQEEIEAAAAKMNALLLKFNLTMDDVEAYAKRTGRRVTHEEYGSGHARWKVDLMFVVAKAHLCKAVYHSGRGANGGKMTVVGHEHNLIVCRDIWYWLMKVVARLDGPAADASGVYWEAQARGQNPKTAISKWMLDFRMGFVDGIREAFEAMREEVKAETDPGTWGLVAVIDSEVMELYRELFPKLGHRSGYGFGYSDAREQGRQAGRSTNLSRQVGGGSANKALAS